MVRCSSFQLFSVSKNALCQRTDRSIENSVYPSTGQPYFCGRAHSGIALRICPTCPHNYIYLFIISIFLWPVLCLQKLHTHIAPHTRFTTHINIEFCLWFCSCRVLILNTYSHFTSICKAFGLSVGRSVFLLSLHASNQYQSSTLVRWLHHEERYHWPPHRKTVRLFWGHSKRSIARLFRIARWNTSLDKFFRQTL